jgi:nucleoside-diphosphate-sugar epimerase
MKPAAPRPHRAPSTTPAPWLRDAAGHRIAILGADGFIGSHLTRVALLSGARVSALCIKEPWRLEDLSDRALTVERIGSGHWWTAEALSRVAGLLPEVDALVVLAYRPPTADSVRDRLAHELRINTRTVGRLAHLAAARELRFVFASSADVYGPWHDEPVSERVLAQPITPYASAKWEAERLIADAFRGSPRHVSLRLATVYGPGENGPRAIPSFIRTLARGERPVVYGDGLDVRDYVHVRDVAAAALNAAVGPADLDPAVNIGTGLGRTTLEVLAAVAETMGVDSVAVHEPTDRPPSRLVLEVGRARASLDLDPAADFASSLAEEADWLLDVLMAAS